MHLLLKQGLLRAALAALLFMGQERVTAQDFAVISEFMAGNTQTLTDEDGDYPDWIELHNFGSTPVNLDGWYLTDSTNLMTQWRFPATNMAAGAYLVVFASGKDRKMPGQALHTGFSLNVDGEYLALVRPDGTNVASEFAPVYPPQYSDKSYGLGQAGGVGYLAAPTPGAANGLKVAGFVADTHFSHGRGFYDAPFDLVISCATAAAEIRYTTNGTVPAITNGYVYTAPIAIRGTTVLRAAAFKSGYQPSNVDTLSYLFPEDIIRQSPTGQPPAGWPSSWGSNTRDYGMDPDVVNNTRYSGTIKNDLKSLPSFSIVMKLGDLFDPATGIYANASQEGRSWERPASIELIYPDGTTGFHIDAGIRIRGGYSRSTGNPKHAFRFFFRSDYGAPKLKYPLFGPGAADTFDNVDLRTFQNYSWSFEGDSRGIFVRDQFSRDTQLAMGDQAERGNYYHLYINGQYWGLYNTCERPEASYAETYYGGRKEDYDVIKVESGPYTLNATDGNMTAWTKLFTMVSTNLVSDALYNKIQGRNPDGSRNPNFDNLLDVPNLIDYMLVILYGGNLDAPISNFLGNQSPNNWYGIRSRVGTNGFRFFCHDAEHTLLNVNEDRTGPYTAGAGAVSKSSPQYVWQKLQSNKEFRLAVADLVHKQFYNGGVLTVPSATNRFLKRIAQIDRAVVGESARWGDAKRATPLTHDVEWLGTVNSLLTSYFPQRSAIVLAQLRADGLYPNITATVFSQHGGNINPDFALTITAPAGTIYYTLDGSDPRLPGGAASTRARVPQGSVVLQENCTVKSRALVGTNWSACNEAAFTVIQTFTELMITEIMYNPPAQNALSGDEFEFVELKNIGGKELDLSEVHFTNGISFTFPNGSRLGAGQFAVLVRNPEAFAMKYPGVAIRGIYQGRLDNQGETLTLDHAVGTPITSVTYQNSVPWPAAANGQGFSLVPLSLNLNPNPNDPAHWRASSRLGGSPGTDDPPLDLIAVQIHEILVHPTAGESATIELYNPSNLVADISGWFLSDDRSVPGQYRFPTPTLVSANGFLLISSDALNQSPGASRMSLDPKGGSVYLYSADASGNLTGYSDGFDYEASASGVTFGRFTNSMGSIQFPAQSRNTLGALNSGPRVGPVVINEIHYHPTTFQDEFIELKNITTATIKLYDVNHPSNTWRVSGISYDLPPGIEIEPLGLALIVAIDPATFRSKYSVPDAVPVLGPYMGALQDQGETIELLQPGVPAVDNDGIPYTPYIVVDAVRYDEGSPWPALAGGGGCSLEKIQASSYGNDPISWRASNGPPSPGFDNNRNRPPSVIAGSDQEQVSATFPVVLNLQGIATDDGLPGFPHRLQTTWSQVSGPGPVEFEDASKPATRITVPGVGTYRVRLTANDGELSHSDELEITLSRPFGPVTLVATNAVWKYFDQGIDLLTTWREPGFDDSQWAQGPARLGYGNDGEITPVSFGPNASAKYRTTYFRHEFYVQNPASVFGLVITLLRDDGAVVYLNGQDQFHSNMPEGEILYDDFADSLVSGVDEQTFFEKQIAALDLKPGTNVLQVEVHQFNLDSSDLSFALQLDALMPPDNQPPSAAAGGNQTVSFPTPALLRGTVSDDGLPMPPGYISCLWSKVSGPGEVSFDSTRSITTKAFFSSPGQYVLRLEASDGVLTASSQTTITVLGETRDGWNTRFFNAEELLNPVISGDSADPDQDGLSNAAEFLAGTNPKDAQSCLRFTRAYAAADGLRLAFDAVINRSYSIYCRDSAQPGQWLPLTNYPAQTVSQTIEFLAGPMTSSSLFYILTIPSK